LKHLLEFGSEAAIVAAALRAIRKKRGLTAIEVAAAMGLAR
jgi:transcriptional regulator with XRE-family HTH domain